MDLGMEKIDAQRVNYKKEGFALFKYDDGPLHSYPYDAPWLTDKIFSKLYNKIRDNTLIDRNRCYALYLLMEQVEKIEGNVLEVGTWRGGTAGIFTTSLPNKTVYLADTFKGVVKSAEWEHYKDKAHDDTSEQLVRDFLSKDLGVTNYDILMGIFPEDTGHKVDAERFAFVYLDVDVYESTKDAFNYVWDKVTPGGIIAFDDYGMTSACAGIKKFIDEVKGDNDKLFFQNLNAQAYIIKRW